MSAEACRAGPSGLSPTEGAPRTLQAMEQERWCQLKWEGEEEVLRSLRSLTFDAFFAVSDYRLYSMDANERRSPREVAFLFSVTRTTAMVLNRLADRDAAAAAAGAAAGAAAAPALAAAGASSAAVDAAASGGASEEEFNLFEKEGAFETVYVVAGGALMCMGQCRFQCRPAALWGRPLTAL